MMKDSVPATRIHPPVSPPIGHHARLCTPAYHAEPHVDLEQSLIIIEVDKSCILHILTRSSPSALIRLHIYMHRGSVLRYLVCLSAATIFLCACHSQPAHPNAITGCKSELRCRCAVAATFLFWIKVRGRSWATALLDLCIVANIPSRVYGNRADVWVGIVKTSLASLIADIFKRVWVRAIAIVLWPALETVDPFMGRLAFAHTYSRWVHLTQSDSAAVYVLHDQTQQTYLKLCMTYHW
jgi:hypothetical protein